ncbi:MAG: hypothetical protein WAK17_15225 [Candidatus Nitrosopolaris sp.]
MAIALDQVVVENTLLAAIIVQFTSKDGLRKKHIDAKRETKKITINFDK